MVVDSRSLAELSGLLQNMRGRHSIALVIMEKIGRHVDVHYMGVRLGILGISRTIVFEKDSMITLKHSYDLAVSRRRLKR